MIDQLLERVEKVRNTGTGRWIARCPAHDDKSPSLAIRLLDDGRILLHCFAQCDTASVLAAIGLTFEDLFPERREGDHFPRVRRPFNAIDILRCVAFEAHIAAVAASNIAQGTHLTGNDRVRMTLAASRLHRAVEVAEDA